MADRDPWEKPDAGQRDPWEKPDPPAQSWAGSAIGAVEDFGKGLAKGVGNVAEELPTLGTPHVSELDPNAKQFLQSPSSTPSEAIGSFAGENLPFMFGGPEAGIIKGIAPRVAPYLGRAAGDALSTLAAHTFMGGVAGAAQPTKEGESRLTNAAVGAGTAGLLSPSIAGKASKMLGVGGGAIGLEEIARSVGVPGWALLPMLGAWSWHGLMHNSGLGRLAEQAGRTASKSVPAGVKGAVAGQVAEKAQENLKRPE